MKYYFIMIQRLHFKSCGKSEMAIKLINDYQINDANETVANQIFVLLT